MEALSWLLEKALGQETSGMNGWFLTRQSLHDPPSDKYIM
jgi:hypothetical protein